MRNSVNSMVDAYNALLVSKTGKRPIVRRSKYSFKPQAIARCSRDEIPVYSYNCTEYLYKSPTPLFPTLARGLFVIESGREGSNDWKIVVRGYDKFFNVDEVPATRWKNLETETCGPYEATLKENGCIIFVAALAGDLIVTSKHSMGALRETASYDSGENKASHAQKGEEWLVKHLAAAGRTREELSQFLEAKNVTAVFELVDDDFEEHILEYPPEARGLYLHGLNENIPEFRTWSSAKLKPVAAQFGLHLVDAVVFNTVAEVRAFSDSCRKTGAYNGRAIEGFVVRCRRNEDLDNVFFFKIKYDEPYLMFREWREVTNHALSTKAKKNKYRPRFELTKRYIAWVEEKIKSDPAFFRDFKNQKGIVAARNRFLLESNIPGIGEHIVAESRRTTQEFGRGESTIKSEEEIEAEMLEKELSVSKKQNGKIRPDRLSQDQHACKAAKSRENSAKKSAGRTSDGCSKTLVIPVATIGAGKTLLGRTLARLYPALIGHIQNDDITAKKAAQVFERKIMQEFETKDIVYADKNNHLFQHRKNISESFKERYPSGKVIVLDWQVEQAVKEMGMNGVLDLTAQRVAVRGENHQSLTPARTGDVRGVIRMFLAQRDPLNPGKGPDALIEKAIPLALRETPKDVLFRVIHALGLPVPSSKEYAAAAEAASQHVETVLKQVKGASAQRRPRYYGIKIEDAEEALQFLEARLSTENDGTRQIWDILKEQKRLEKQKTYGWHVTLCHAKAHGEDKLCREYQGRIDDYIKQHPATPTSANGRADSEKGPRTSSGIPVVLRLTEIAWDSRAMALVVEKPLPAALKCMNDIPHITVATASDDIKPFVSNEVLADAKKGKNGVRRLEFPEPLVVKGQVCPFYW
ncbi:hypothetical protein HDU87_008791 [Geranomyces variabilis]|uniref:tRNA ligase n=1 Tax=Geranomyces variabilis TaxID=109894 RepID=A0AAD5XMH6_9FUNG|nr:hypothetical protein HDU87_008791 [Geranomyces variabilis]